MKRFGEYCLSLCAVASVSVLLACVLLPSVLLLLGAVGYAQEGTAAKAELRQTEDKLDAQQRKVYDQWRKLEEVLLRMAEMAADSDPDRAELLRRVVSLGKQKMVDNQFKSMIDLLEEGKLSRALDQQMNLRTDLVDLLKVLETENRMKKVLSEKERLKGYLKELDGIIAGQKSLQNRTMDSEQPQSLAPDQKKLAEQAQNLKDRIKADESPEGTQAGEKQAEEKQAEEKQAGEQQAGEQQAGEQQAGEQQAGEQQAGEQQAGEQQAGEQQAGEQQAGEQQAGEKRLEKAQKRMEEAQKQLEQAQKENAVEKQEEALRELEQAKKDLEEILRQLREEEQKRTLTQLEARFRKMYQKQKLIYDSTARLSEMVRQEGDSAAVRGTVSQESARLGGQESDILLEGQKALLLLRQDGTAAAMTEVLESACEEMQGVSELFARQDVSKLNQTRQENILSTLEELIDSVNRQLKENEAKQNQQDGQSGASEMEEGLVDKLAELRIIRSQQLRINRSTKVYSELRAIEGDSGNTGGKTIEKSGKKPTEEALGPEKPTGAVTDLANPKTEVEAASEAVLSDSLKKAVDELAKRQNRLKEILHDMSMGRNQ